VPLGRNTRSKLSDCLEVRQCCYSLDFHGRDRFGANIRVQPQPALSFAKSLPPQKAHAHPKLCAHSYIFLILPLSRLSVSDLFLRLHGRGFALNLGVEWIELYRGA
jgi:hypothetical protein